MDRDTDPQSADPSAGQLLPTPAVGHTASLLLLPSRTVVPLGPAWAVLCGALAAGQWRWDGSKLLALVATLFVAEVLWSSWRAHLVSESWSSLVHEHPLPPTSDPVYALPYTTPWSPLGCALRRWGQVRYWVRDVLPAQKSGSLLALIVLPPLILLLSVAISEEMLLLSIVALALVLIEWRIARHGLRYCLPQAAVEIAISWLAGHVVFAPLDLPSLVLACCFAVAYQGALGLQRTGSSDSPRAWSLGLFLGGQVAAAVAILPFSPAAAAGIGLLLAPQLLLLGRRLATGGPIRYLGQAAPFLMLAMALAAWAV